MSRRYLILHLNSNGDLLYATAIARQLKEHDDPGCHITWAVASSFKNILLNNPYIDTLWEIPAGGYIDIKENIFTPLQAAVRQRAAAGEWDEVICPQLMFGNMWRYDGTIRRAVLKSYKKPVVNTQPVLRLTVDEVNNVEAFATKHGLSAYEHVVLFECSPLSGQSSVNPEFAEAVAMEILSKHSNIVFILSSNKKIEAGHPSIVDGSALSFRENAELTKYCSLLVGCSSGITWIAQSDWAKPLPMLQLSSTGINPVGRDFEREGTPAGNLVEMYRFTKESTVSCLQMMLEGSFAAAKARYHQEVPPEIPFIEGILLHLLHTGAYKKAVVFTWRNIKAHHFHPALVKMLLQLPVKGPLKWWRRKRPA